jgi:purine nucleoside phosphorylase
MVGMTAMPEAVLAREAGVAYAVCAVGVNHAAGRGPAGAGLHAQVEQYLAAGLAKVRFVLEALLPEL